MPVTMSIMIDHVLQWKVYPSRYRVRSASITLIQITRPRAFKFSSQHEPTPYSYTMSQSRLTITPSSNSNFVSVFRTAIKAYKERTGQDITSHPLSTWLNTCDSPDTILAVLRAQDQEFDHSRRDDERLTKWRFFWMCWSRLGVLGFAEPKPCSEMWFV